MGMAVANTKRKDGAFGWLVVMASFCSHFFQYGIVWTVGVFYVIFLQHIGGSKGAVALISSLNTAVFYATGPLASALTNVYGCRRVALVGGLIGCIGMVLSMFANTLVHLYCTFGVLTGFGLGLSYIPSVTIVSHYFEEKRSLALGFAVSGIGFGTFAFPPIIRLFNKMFGWRGSILVIGGICLNICVCAAIFRPFEEEEVRKEVKVVVTPQSKEETSNEGLIKRMLKAKRTLNLGIFRNTNYLVLCVNNILVTFGLSVVYVHLASFAISIGFDNDKSAILFSVVGVSNFGGRILFGILGHCPWTSGIALYCVGFFFSGVVVIFTPYATTYPGLLFCAVAFGLTTGCFGPSLPQTIIELLEVELLTSAYGYLLVFQAIGTLIGAPVAGFIYDYYEYYPASLYLGGACIVIASAIMLWPWYAIRRQENTLKYDVPEIKISSYSLPQIAMLNASSLRGSGHLLGNGSLSGSRRLTDSGSIKGSCYQLDPLSQLKKQTFYSMHSLASYVEERQASLSNSREQL